MHAPQKLLAVLTCQCVLACQPQWSQQEMKEFLSIAWSWRGILLLQRGTRHFGN